jgi:hypothetical protein
MDIEWALRQGLKFETAHLPGEDFPPEGCAVRFGNVARGGAQEYNIR